MSNTDWYSMMLYRWNIQNRQESLIHLDNIKFYQVSRKTPSFMSEI